MGGIWGILTKEENGLSNLGYTTPTLMSRKLCFQLLFIQTFPLYYTLAVNTFDLQNQPPPKKKNLKTSSRTFDILNKQTIKIPFWNTKSSISHPVKTIGDYGRPSILLPYLITQSHPPLGPHHTPLPIFCKRKMLIAVFSTFAVPNQSSILWRSIAPHQPPQFPSNQFPQITTKKLVETCGDLLQLDTSSFTISPPLPQNPCILAKIMLQTAIPAL